MNLESGPDIWNFVILRCGHVVVTVFRYPRPFETSHDASLVLRRDSLDLVTVLSTSVQEFGFVNGFCKHVFSLIFEDALVADDQVALFWCTCACKWLCQ